MLFLRIVHNCFREQVHFLADVENSVFSLFSMKIPYTYIVQNSLKFLDIFSCYSKHSRVKQLKMALISSKNLFLEQICLKLAKSVFTVRTNVFILEFMK